MSVSQQQIAAILALSGEERFNHFVKVVVDQEAAWGLYQEGWAMALTDEGFSVLPLWPREEFAVLCAIQKWSDYNARLITLENLINRVLPGLKKEGSLPGVFYTVSGKCVTPSVDQLIKALSCELQKY